MIAARISGKINTMDMDHSYAVQIFVADAPASAVRNDSPPCFKLIADCWEHIFDYLTLEEVYAMGQTCWHLHRMAGYYFREYFHDIRFDLIRKKVRIHYLYNIRLRTDFYQYIGKLSIWYSNELEYFLDADTFASLKSLSFWGVKSIEIQIDYARNVLKNIESIEFYATKSVGNVFERIASCCPKLKVLRVKSPRKIRTRSEHNAFNKIFLQRFLKLEHLKINVYDENAKINELKIFLKNHTKLKHLECDYRFLWANRNLLNETNNQLDVLTIHFHRENDAIPFDQFVDFLNQLFIRGIYKALHLHLDHFENVDFNTVISTLPVLQKVNTYSNDVIDYLRLTNLMELSIFEIDEGDFEQIAKSLTKLERVRFQHASANHILPFIHFAKKIKTIKVYGRLRDDHVLDLFTLNEQRKKLGYARQVCIHVDEKVYLREKWKSKNLDLSHVRIARLN